MSMGMVLKWILGKSKLHACLQNSCLQTIVNFNMHMYMYSYLLSLFGAILILLISVLIAGASLLPNLPPHFMMKMTERSFKRWACSCSVGYFQAKNKFPSYSHSMHTVKLSKKNRGAEGVMLVSNFIYDACCYIGQSCSKPFACMFKHLEYVHVVNEHPVELPVYWYLTI